MFYCILSYSAWIPMHVLTWKAREQVPRQYQAVFARSQGKSDICTESRADICRGTAARVLDAPKTAGTPFTNINSRFDQILAYVKSLTTTKLDIKLYNSTDPLHFH